MRLARFSARSRPAASIHTANASMKLARAPPTAIETTPERSIAASKAGVVLTRSASSRPPTEKRRADSNSRPAKSALLSVPVAPSRWWS